MSKQVTLVLEYWNPKDRCSCTPEITRTEEISGTQEEIFIEFYNRNCSLRYCNGSYWKFQDQNVALAYKKFDKKHDTIANYYGSGTID